MPNPRKERPDSDNTSGFKIRIHHLVDSVQPSIGGAK
jgi:hypothetical protein